MNTLKYLNQNGSIKVVDESYRTKRKPRIELEEPQEIISFCLKCTRKKCNGNCKEIREFKKKYGNKNKTEEGI